MLNKPKKKFFKLALLKIAILSPILFSIFSLNTQVPLQAGLEFQWEDNENYRKLKWFQKNNQRSLRNTIYFFLRPSDRKAGLLKIEMTIPEKFKVKLNENKIELCKVRIGGFESRTTCLEDIPAEIEISEDNTKLTIYPLSPIPADKESYAIVFKVNNPKRTGLYQFHGFGQISGDIPITSYLGSWTIVID